MVKLGPKMFGKVRRTSRSNFEHFRTSQFGPKPNFEPREHHQNPNSSRTLDSSFQDYSRPRIFSITDSILKILLPPHIPPLNFFGNFNLPPSLRNFIFSCMLSGSSPSNKTMLMYHYVECR